MRQKRRSRVELTGPVGRVWKRPGLTAFFVFIVSIPAASF